MQCACRCGRTAALRRRSGAGAAPCAPRRLSTGMLTRAWSMVTDGWPRVTPARRCGGAPCRACSSETLEPTRASTKQARRVRRRHANIIPAAPEAVHKHCAVGEYAHTAICIVRRPRPLDGGGHCEVRGLACHRGERTATGVWPRDGIRMVRERARLVRDWCEIGARLVRDWCGQKGVPRASCVYGGSGAWSCPEKVARTRPGVSSSKARTTCAGQHRRAARVSARGQGS